MTFNVKSIINIERDMSKDIKEMFAEVVEKAVKKEEVEEDSLSVSYTHLTLPTILLV